MRLFLILLTTLLLAACDYNVPLVTQPERPINVRAVGLWQQTGEKNIDNKLALLPLGNNEYLVAFPAQQKEAMYARATLWQEDGLRLIQLKWIGTAQGTTPKNSRIYQYARYRLNGDRLTINLLNPDVVSKDVGSSGALADAIREHRNDAELFRKAMHFKRITDDEG